MLVLDERGCPTREETSLGLKQSLIPDLASEPVGRCCSPKRRRLSSAGTVRAAGCWPPPHGSSPRLDWRSRLRPCSVARATSPSVPLRRQSVRRRSRTVVFGLHTVGFVDAIQDQQAVVALDSIPGRVLALLSLPSLPPVLRFAFSLD